MAKPVIWSPLSEKDFTSILDYLQTNWSRKTVLQFIDITNDLVYQISVNPQQFPLIQKRDKIRKCVITKHNSLFYRERKGLIDILRIYDSRQDPQKLKL